MPGLRLMHLDLSEMRRIAIPALKKHGLLNSKYIRSRKSPHMRLDPYAWPVEGVP